MDQIDIDGAMGEGGGQILRTALALSACTGRPFVIDRLRARRQRPGLLRQHLTAVQAAQAICGAVVEGAEIGSCRLSFTPGPVTAGSYRFAVGTAGSATLVAQTVIPPLLLAAGPSTLRLAGGTHNPLSPPFHFLRDVFLPALGQMGANCTAEFGQWGFYPAGGGSFTVEVNPPAVGRLQPVDLGERGNLLGAEIQTVVAEVPWEVADDEARLIVKAARFPISRSRADTVVSAGPGNVAMLTLQFAHTTAMFTGFGARGVSRRQVAHQVFTPANLLFASGAAVDEHLADQLLIPLALAGGGRFSTVAPSSHTTTNAKIVERFLPVRITWVQEAARRWVVEVKGCGE